MRHVIYIKAAPLMRSHRGGPGARRVAAPPPSNQQHGGICMRDTPWNAPEAAPRDPRLAPLSELDDYRVADGEPDIRGWQVRTRAGSEIGTVADLIVDPARMKVRSMDVQLDRAGADGRHVLVPVGVAQLDARRDDVFVDTGAASLLAAPTYRREALLDREYERALLGNYGYRGRTAGQAPYEDFYRGPYFDDRTFFAGRRRRAHTAYVSRAETARRDAC
jgi:hypothetical protein